MQTRGARPHRLHARARKAVLRIGTGIALVGGLLIPGLAGATPALADTTVAVHVDAGWNSVCVITDAGGVKCWGLDDHGQLGDGNSGQNVYSVTPVDVQGLSGTVKQLAMGSKHVCALIEGGTVQCWGYNGYGQLGDNFNEAEVHTPQTVAGLSNVKQISAAESHTCALLNDGTMKCWGENFDGELGDGSTSEKDVPTTVSSLSGSVSSMSTGESHTCAVLDTGALQCWGSNNWGELGDNNRPYPSPLPTDVIGLDAGVETVVAAQADTCVLMTDRSVRCWGDNRLGEIGDNQDIAHEDTPQPVMGLGGGVAELAAGRHHACVVMQSGGLKCWGDNFDGDIGLGFQNPCGPDCDESNPQNIPIDVPGLTSGVWKAAADGTSTCALTAFGGVKCWGSNALGQLGNGDSALLDQFSPVDVSGLGGGASDFAPPQLTVSFTAPNGGVPNGQNGWFVTGPVKGKAVADDAGNGGSNISTLSCSGLALKNLTGIGTPHASGTFQVKPESVKHLVCTATDSATNPSLAKTLDVMLDKTPPTAKVTVKPKPIPLNTKGKIRVKASDALSGYTKHNYTCGKLNTKTKGNKTVSCTVYDNAGNSVVAIGSYKVV
jgi:alpha-tubulin suppressor-like RCC1 family protein